MLLLGPSKLQSLDLTPWYGQDKLLKLHSWATYQYYPTLDTAQGTVHQANNNLFVGSSLSIASNNKYAAEIESSFFRTNLHTFSMENVRITVRRQWLNDIPSPLLVRITNAELWPRKLLYAWLSRYETSPLVKHNTSCRSWRLQVVRIVL